MLVMCSDFLIKKEIFKKSTILSKGCLGYLIYIRNCMKNVINIHILDSPNFIISISNPLLIDYIFQTLCWIFWATLVFMASSEDLYKMKKHGRSLNFPLRIQSLGARRKSVSFCETWVLWEQVYLVHCCSQPLTQCLTHAKCSISICGLKKQMNDWRTKWTF